MLKSYFRGSILRALLLGTLLPACGGQMDGAEGAASTTQELASTEASAWVFATGGTGTIASRSFNSAGGTNSVSNPAYGVYDVTFGGLHFSGGNLQVTAAGSTSVRCKIQNWADSSPFEFSRYFRVRVLCHNAAGTPTKSAFVLSYARFDGGTATSSAGAYLWMNQLRGGTLDAATQWGAAATAAAGNPGEYTVTLPNQIATGSNVQVSAVGQDANYCKVLYWYGTGSGTAIRVNCFAAGGAPADSTFMLHYYRETREPRYEGGGFVWADQAASSSYTPSPTYQRDVINYQCGGQLTYTNQARRLSVGRYAIDYPSQNGAVAAAAHVTAYGSGAGYCTLGDWSSYGSGMTVTATCFDAAGNPSDLQFDQVFWGDVVAPC